MKIVTVEQMRLLDESTFRDWKIPSRAIMESAGRVVAEVALQYRGNILVLCGKGNNGGDGLVAARVLSLLGRQVSVFLLEPNLSGDAAQNLETLQLACPNVPLLSRLEQLREEISKAEIVIDAIYGIGFRGELSGHTQEACRLINLERLRGDLPVIAVDIPSGVHADLGTCSADTICASKTVALQHLKFGHVLFPATKICGEVVLADVGIRDAGGEAELLSGETLRPISGFSPVSHKGSRGHVFVVGGSTGKYGAATLAGYSALLSGAGLVTVALAESGVRGLSAFAPEIMTVPLSTAGGGEAIVAALAQIRKAALVVGPGLGTSPEAASLLKIAGEWSRKNSFPLVLDADGLNLLAANPELRELLSEELIMTPHPGEAARLLDSSVGEIEAQRIASAKEIAGRFRAECLLKGARAIIASRDGTIAVNPAATAVLATGGSGDVLSGVIGALLSGGLNPKQALRAAVYAHGRAGEELGKKGSRGVTARHIAQAIPNVLNEERGLRTTSFVRHALQAVAYE